jgi:phytoene desaturase
MLLAQSGVRVRVLERLSVPGGRTSTIATPEGFKFDLGPTFFLYPKILDEILRAAGTNLRKEVEMIRLDPQYRIQFGTGGKIDATPNPE